MLFNPDFYVEQQMSLYLDTVIKKAIYQSIYKHDYMLTVIKKYTFVKICKFDVLRVKHRSVFMWSYNCMQNSIYSKKVSE